MSRSLAMAIREQVAEDLASPSNADLDTDDRRELARQQVFVHLDALTTGNQAVWAPCRSSEDEQQLAQSVLDALFGLGRLQTLIDNPEIENIDVNGCDRVWITFADGTKQLTSPIADSDEELVDVIRSAGSRFGLSERRFDLACPELDLRLPDGSRLSALMAVSARPALSIRRHRYLDLSLADLAAMGTVDDDIARLLSAAVRARKNIIVSGAMNSGKTTLLRALAGEIPPRERIVTIEQALELGLDAAPGRHPDMVALEARPANVEGHGLITVADLVRRALRMNADRVIVGEVLGGEVLPMLNAMSQGRSGSMCTIHADSSAGVFRRIASYAVQAQERLPLEASNVLIAGAIHFVVHIDSETDDDLGPFVDDDPAPWKNGPATARGPRPAHMDGDGIGISDGWGNRDLRSPEDDEVALFSSERLAEPWRFAKPRSRCRFVSSIREVVDAEGSQVISNEVYRPGSDRRAVAASPLRPETLDELQRFVYRPVPLDLRGRRL
jgi:pilus assembly protein CpaF